MARLRSNSSSSWSVVAGFVTCCALIFALALHPPRTKPKDHSTAPFQIVDMLGRTHGFAEPPKRIFFSANVMPTFLTLAGSADRIVGASDLGRSGMDRAFLDRIFPGASRARLIGGTERPNFEEVLRSSPDAVLGWSSQINSIEKGASFEFVAFQTAYPLTRSHLALWRRMAEISGASERAETLLRRYAEETEAIARTVRDASKVTALIVVSNENSSWIGGPKQYINERLELVGATNVARHGAVAAHLSLEQVAVLDPDVILLQGSAGQMEPEYFMNDHRWRLLRAVRAAKVYRVPEFPIFVVPVFDPLLERWLARVLHPEIEDDDLRAGIRRTYAEIYGYSPNDDDLDELLALAANARSAGYQRFERHRERRALSQIFIAGRNGLRSSAARRAERFCREFWLCRNFCLYRRVERVSVTQLTPECIELLRWTQFAPGPQLVLSDHMHELDPRECRSSGSK
ncbi:hypothetical protein CQW49_23980 (plasmid) [Methylosinus trichosporium OB3b]|uniref:Fe/B12 periplasmic-binding domain-containing protein n=1 Tax=Methylosinus trichosporium (strain ATCC 35070 / NCIMB 11131 / UNIQEM 75 / OB3b) TaxID=595536 RepID=A0A2D2D7L0_METT3|nr:hypothetical protein CQW49_23980 [Methylosinus trichosporium OB3b]